MTDKRLKIDTTIKTKKYSLQFAKKIGYFKKTTFSANALLKKLGYGFCIKIFCTYVMEFYACERFVTKIQKGRCSLFNK